MGIKVFPIQLKHLDKDEIFFLPVRGKYRKYRIVSRYKEVVKAMDTKRGYCKVMSPETKAYVFGKKDNKKTKSLIGPRFLIAIFSVIMAGAFIFIFGI